MQTQTQVTAIMHGKYYWTALICASFFYFCTASASEDRIAWRHWNAEAFADAKQHHRMLMVNVGYEGCTACRYMDENTFRDKSVISLLNKHFISIQVDSEARPDIGERYSDWAWPATAFMHPDGTQIFAIRGSRKASKFVAMLENLVARHASGTLKTDDRAPYGAPVNSHDGSLADIQQQVRDQLDRSFDAQRGGWGKGAKILEYPGPILQLFMRGHLYDNNKLTARGLQTTEGFAQQTDTVWGGVFYASLNSWTNTIKEKRLETQAAALRIFADALQVSGDASYATAISEIDRYLSEHMQSASGLYYSSQKDLNADLASLDSDEYYRLGDQQRRAIAYPQTDHATYTDLNARIAYGYLRAFQATQQRKYLDSAVAVMNSILANRRHPDGWFIQLDKLNAARDDRRAHMLFAAERPFLRTQAYTGLALINLYQATNEISLLEAARALALAIESTLEDPSLGGFYATTTEPGTPAHLKPRKPLEDNAATAMFFYWLGVIDKNANYKSKAATTLRAVAIPSIVKREGRITGNLAVALELITNGYVEMSVVGDEQDPAAQALFNAAHAVYEPRKVVHFEKPGRYPARDQAALYICNDDACSLPITTPSVVQSEALKFAPHAFTN